MASILSNILAPSASLFSLPVFPSFPLLLVSLYRYQRQREEERYLEQIITTGLAGGCLLYFSCSEHSHFVVSILQILPRLLTQHFMSSSTVESDKFFRELFLHLRHTHFYFKRSNVNESRKIVREIYNLIV